MVKGPRGGGTYVQNESLVLVAGFVLSADLLRVYLVEYSRQQPGVHPPAGNLLARIQVALARTVHCGGGGELPLWNLHRSGVRAHSQLLLPYASPRNEGEAR